MTNLHHLPRSKDEIAFDPQPGDVFYTSWGYDQTNTEFFEVVSRTKATVKVRQISARLGEGSDASGESGTRLYPVPGAYVSDFRHKDEEKVCRLRKVTGRHSAEPGYVATSLRIDDVRSAFPYSTGGSYDTRAAGQPGH